MIVIFGAGIIGLFIAKELLESKKVLVFDTSDVSANATSASIMLHLSLKQNLMKINFFH